MTNRKCRANKSVRTTRSTRRARIPWTSEISSISPVKGGEASLYRVSIDTLSRYVALIITPTIQYTRSPVHLSECRVKYRGDVAARVGETPANTQQFVYYYCNGTGYCKKSGDNIRRGNNPKSMARSFLTPRELRAIKTARLWKTL